MRLEELQALGLVPKVGDELPNGCKVLAVSQDPTDASNIDVTWFVPTPIDFVRITLIPLDAQGNIHGAGGPINIIVNGQNVSAVRGQEMTYDEIVRLAFGAPPGTILSVTYRRAEQHKSEGILAPDGSVRVKNGTVFNVADTSGA